MAKKHCECCGAPMVEYKHGMTRGQAKCLYRFVQSVGHDNPFSPIEISSVGFNFAQRCNFSKSRYWGLIEKAGDQESVPNGGGGLWKLTKKGLDFVSGEIAVPKYAITFRGEMVRLEGDNVYITDVTDGWSYRPDYARDAIAHE